MSKLSLVVKREYLERVRSKWFLIGTILGPLIMSSFVLVPVLVEKLSSPNVSIAVVDASGDPELITKIEERIKSEKTRGKYQIEHKSARTEEELEELKSVLKGQVEERKIQGYLVITPSVVTKGVAEYYSKNVTDFSTNRYLEDVITRTVVEKRFNQTGLDPKRVEELSKRIKLTTKKLSEDGSKEDKGQSFLLAISLMMIIYMMTLIYGITVLRGVIEEKQNRIVEVIVSSISPTELMLGKVLGIGLVGITQFLVWSLFIFAIPSLAGSMLVGVASAIPDVSISLMIYFVIYFVLGYFLYATLYAMAGSIVSNDQDANQVQTPITFLIVIPMLLIQVVLRDPNSTASTILSLIPFFTPLLMFLRINIETPAFWQIGLSILLMMASIFACAWIAGKIYRVGILMYGKRPSIPELLKWLRYT
ncbi:MAG: ABC transporter permease [Blastocatellia bacterium]|nr:ABC transporter permease [Blastocatellia bacterium]